MKKIAIISEFNRDTVNYGNRLQAMALNQYLKNVFPDYKIEYLYFSFWDNFIITKEKTILEKVCNAFGAVRRRVFHQLNSVKRLEERIKVCEKFSIDNMTLANKAYTWDDLLNSDFDIIIVGSDVVWAQGSGKVGRLRFLDFDLGKSFNRISYAASFGRDWIPEENVDEIRRCLKQFKSISVRENSSVELLKNIGIQSVHVVDPTLLLSKEDWEKYENVPNIMQERKCTRYVFTYLLGTEKKVRESVTKWAKSKNLKIVTIPYVSGRVNNADRKFGDIQIMDCSPENWLWMIHHAEYIITDSFHGSVFSTIFEKKLIVMRRDEKIDINNRMIDFMKMIKQSDKVILSSELENINGFKWNYTEIKKILSKEIDLSRSFLDNML